MKLDIIAQTENFADIQKEVNSYFKEQMKLIAIDFSIFEQYNIRCIETKWISGLSKFRVVKEGNNYYFGTI